MSALSVVGLSLFVLGAVLSQLALALDLWLYRTGRTTITAWVARKRWRAWLVFGLVLLGYDRYGRPVYSCPNPPR